MKKYTIDNYWRNELINWVTLNPTVKAVRVCSTKRENGVSLCDLLKTITMGTDK